MVAEFLAKGSLTKEFYFEEGCFIRELYNPMSDQKLSIAQARVAPGGTTKFHRLQGITEYYVILFGAGRVEIGEKAPQDVAPGDVVAIPPECRQRVTNTGSDDLVFLCCCVPRFDSALYEDLEKIKC